MFVPKLKKVSEVVDTDTLQAHIRRHWNFQETSQRVLLMCDMYYKSKLRGGSGETYYVFDFVEHNGNTIHIANIW